MRLTIILCLSLAFLAPILSEKQGNLGGPIERIIIATINAIKSKLPNPISLNKLNFNMTNPLISGIGNISNFNIYGIKGMNVSHVKVKGISALNMTLVFPTITLDTRYFLDYVLMDIWPLYGAGLTSVHLDNLRLDIHGAVKLVHFTHIKISEVNVTLQLGDSIFDIHGFYNNPELSAMINEMMDDQVPRFINEHKKLISSVISPILQAVMNDIL